METYIPEEYLKMKAELEEEENDEKNVKFEGEESKLPKLRGDVVQMNERMLWLNDFYSITWEKWRDGDKDWKLYLVV